MTELDSSNSKRQSIEKCLSLINDVIRSDGLVVEAGTGSPFALRSLADSFDCSVALILLQPKYEFFVYPTLLDDLFCASVQVPQLLQELKTVPQFELVKADSCSELYRIAEDMGMKSPSVVVLTQGGSINGVLIVDCRQELLQYQQETIISVAKSICLASAALALDRLSPIDSFTGLLKLKQFERIVMLQMEIAETMNTVFSIALANIDNMKAINDSYSLHSGDCVIRSVSGRLKQLAPQEFICAQFGSQEFAVYAPHFSKDQLFPVIDRIRQSIFDQVIEVGDNRQYKVSVSFGLAEFPANGSSFTALVRNAEVALDRAKRLGKNLVKSYE